MHYVIVLLMGGNVQLRSHPRVKHLARVLQASFDDVGVVTTCKVDDDMAVNLPPQPLGYFGIHSTV